MFPFIFLLSLQRIWFRSSMDRMKDSGSFDWGSSPHGITTPKTQNTDFSVLGFVFDAILRICGTNDWLCKNG